MRSNVYNYWTPEESRRVKRIARFCLLRRHRLSVAEHLEDFYELRKRHTQVAIIRRYEKERAAMNAMKMHELEQMEV